MHLAESKYVKFTRKHRGRLYYDFEGVVVKVEETDQPSGARISLLDPDTKKHIAYVGGNKEPFERNNGSHVRFSGWLKSCPNSKIIHPNL